MFAQVKQRKTGGKQCFNFNAYDEMIERWTHVYNREQERLKFQLSSFSIIFCIMRYICGNSIFFITVTQL